MDTLTLFATMKILSERMVAAAQANDWDRLAGLECEQAAIRAEIVRLEPDGRPSGELSEADQVRKASLITDMLENDREVRRHVEPWLASARKLLSGTVRDRAVRTVYGALAP
jgi:flagellar protein FliT